MKRSTLLAGLLAVPAYPQPAGGDATGLAPVERATQWVGARPSAAQLSGRAVVVDVFTFECVNCRRIVPALERIRASHAASDLRIVGVHTPEVPSYQGRRAYVERQIAAAGIAWPVAIDNDLRIWNAYGVSAWPTVLVFDRRGRLVATVVGDGDDAALYAAVRRATALGR